ncbi:unnamed protein product, partial [Arctogadus glacialis]
GVTTRPPLTVTGHGRDCPAYPPRTLEYPPARPHAAFLAPGSPVCGRGPRMPPGPASTRYVVFDNGTLLFNDVGAPEEGDYT